MTETDYRDVGKVRKHFFFFFFQDLLIREDL